MIPLATRSGTYLPTESEHHLLCAALLDDPARVKSSLATWESHVDLDAIGYGPFRLLPLLHRNLRRHGIDCSLAPRLKGVYRQSWLRNQVLIEHGLSSVRMLKREGIDVLLLKGAALVATAYEESALRPMADFDLLVTREEFRRAAGVLEREGWSLTPANADREAYFAFRHASAFVRDSVGSIDLHQAAIRDCFDEAGEKEFWAGSLPAKLAGEEVRVLAPPDQLLQICAHAGIPNGVSPIRWVADAMFILARAGATFDWERLIELARMRSLSYGTLRCLEYLQNGMNVEVPAMAMDALRGQSPALSRVSFRMRNAGGFAAYAHLFTVWMRHVFAAKFTEVPRRLSLLPRFARQYFGVDQDRSLSLHLASRLFRHLSRARSKTRVTGNV